MPSSKSSNYRKVEDATERTHMILDNWDKEEFAKASAKDISRTIEKHVDEESTLKVKLLTNDGEFIVESDNFVVTYDRDNNELILKNFV